MAQPSTFPAIFLRSGCRRPKLKRSEVESPGGKFNTEIAFPGKGQRPAKPKAGFLARSEVVVLIL